MINNGETAWLACDRWRAACIRSMAASVDGVLAAGTDCFPHWIIQSSRAKGCRPWCSLRDERSYICNRFLQRAAVAARARAIKFGLLC